MYNFIVMLDITQTADGDVELGTGDLTYTESTGQHKRDLLLADKGHFKENPDRGNTGRARRWRSSWKIIQIWKMNPGQTGGPYRKRNGFSGSTFP